MRRIALLLVVGACSLVSDFSGIEGEGGGAGGSGGSGGGVVWPLPEFAARKRLTLDTTVTNSDLNDVPLAVIIEDLDLAGTSFADGRDIAFMADDGVTQLAHEIESFDQASGALVAWVKVPAIVARTPVDIYLYFGNPNSDGEQNAAGTWPPSHRGVWHLSQDPAAAGKPMLDSTANANHGMPEADPTSVPGVAGNALHFENYARLHIEDAMGVFDFGDASFSFSLWAYITEYSGEGDSFLQKFVNGEGWGVDAVPGSDWYAAIFNAQSSTNASFGPEQNLLGRWSYLVAVVDREIGEIHAYAHGAFTANATLMVRAVTGVGNLQLCPGGNPCIGTIDEVRVIGEPLSVDWIALTHRNLDPDASAFVTLGPLEARPQ